MGVKIEFPGQKNTDFLILARLDAFPSITLDFILCHAQKNASSPSSYVLSDHPVIHSTPSKTQKNLAENRDAYFH
jgi:hypothetical protein